MFEWLGKMTRGMGAAGAKLYFNQCYARYGQMTELKIDKEKRQIEATFLLAGEPEPIEVVLQGYALEVAGEKATVTFEGISVSRPWMATLAQEFIKGKPLVLPSLAAKVLMMVM